MAKKKQVIWILLKSKQTFYFLISATTFFAWIYFMNGWYDDSYAFGKLFSPREGFWANAEPYHKNYNETYALDLQDIDGEIYLDKRLVPHIHANTIDKVVFMQGFIHARFRLWQMDFYMRYASGRLSEIVGNKTLFIDKYMKRQGMVVNARKMADYMLNQEQTKGIIENYCKGVNAYIDQLSYKDYPIEFKLLNYKPEHWNAEKIALIIKLLAYDLTGYDEDFEMTDIAQKMGLETFNKLFPLFPHSASPIFPSNQETQVPWIPYKPLNKPNKAFDYLFDSDFNIPVYTSAPKPEKTNGSNNWAISSALSEYGSPILCYDPHLTLTLPSIWYENQISTPDFNAYGVSIPGAPLVVIGFNDSLSWAFTNSARDVRDYFLVDFTDDQKLYYKSGNSTKQTQKKIDTIYIRNQEPYLLTTYSTEEGPVFMDNLSHPAISPEKGIVLKWKATEVSNELLGIYLSNKAHSSKEAVEVSRHIKCPGQNLLIASSNNDIDLIQRGSFPARWKDQGRFVMPFDSNYFWSYSIPMDENLSVHNPASGVASSSNQNPTNLENTAYYYSGNYTFYRGMTINNYFKSGADSNRKYSITDMKNLQMSSYSLLASNAMDIFKKHTDVLKLSSSAKTNYIELLNWDNTYQANSKRAVIFELWWQYFVNSIWQDEWDMLKIQSKLYPKYANLIEWLNTGDTAWLNYYVDDKSTVQRENVSDIVMASLEQASERYEQMKIEQKDKWYKYQGTRINHLLRLPGFGKKNVKTGGNDYAINSISKTHGPSWRMIVLLSTTPKAYGIIPGGQSGNPGSFYYDNQIKNWANGKYYSLNFVKNFKEKSSELKYTIEIR